MSDTLVAPDEPGRPAIAGDLPRLMYRDGPEAFARGWDAAAIVLNYAGAVRDGVMLDAPWWLPALLGAALAAPWGLASGALFGAALIVAARFRGGRWLTRAAVAGAGGVAVLLPASEYQVLSHSPLGGFGGILPTLAVLSPAWTASATALGVAFALGTWRLVQSPDDARLSTGRVSALPPAAE